MPDYAQQFRQSVQQRHQGKRPRGRYPERLRELALEHLAETSRAGGALTTAAEDLGIDANTLRAWQGQRRRSEDGPGARHDLMPVRIADVPAAGVELPFVVRVPGSVTVACATAADVAELVRVLA